MVVDFPRTHALAPDQKEKNDALADKFDVSAFPTVIVMDGNGNKLDREEGLDPDLSAKSFVEKLKKLAAKAKTS